MIPDVRRAPRAYARPVDQRRRATDDPMRVVIAHASPSGRFALRMLVDAEPGVEVVAAAASATDAGRLAREHGADFLVVYEALLAVGRPGVLPSSCALVILGLEDHPAAAAAAKARGARAYVLWDRTAEDLPPLLHGAAVQPFAA
jgi:DNA-binding NarL/FixJ family response regulator